MWQRMPIFDHLNIIPSCVTLHYNIQIRYDKTWYKISYLTLFFLPVRQCRVKELHVLYVAVECERWNIETNRYSVWYSMTFSHLQNSCKFIRKCFLNSGYVIFYLIFDIEILRELPDILCRTKYTPTYMNENGFHLMYNESIDRTLTESSHKLLVRQPFHRKILTYCCYRPE